MAEIPMVKCRTFDSRQTRGDRTRVHYIPLKDFSAWKSRILEKEEWTIQDEIFSIWFDGEEAEKYPYTFNRLHWQEVKEIKAECYCEHHSLCETCYIPAHESEQVLSSLPGIYRAKCRHPRKTEFGNRFTLKEKPGYWIQPQGRRAAV